MSPAPTARPTLFEQIGGEPAIRKLVDDFYRRVFADAELKAFFENTPKDRLLRMQYEFFAAALDGPSKYEGKQLSDVHFGRGIDIASFGRFSDRLFDALGGLNLSDETVHEIIGRLNVYVDEITGGTNDAG